MGVSSKTKAKQKQEDMLAIVAEAQGSRKVDNGLDTGVDNIGPAKAKTQDRVGNIRLTDLKVTTNNEEITGIVVSPEYLQYLESKALEKDVGTVDFSKFSPNFTEMCIRHLLDSGYSVQGKDNGHYASMQNAITFAELYKQEVVTQKNFFLKNKEVRND